jgi:hypothetical protein
VNIERQEWGAITEGLGAPIRKLLEQRSGTPTSVTLAGGQQILVYDVAWGRDMGDRWEHVTANCSPSVSGHDIHFFFLSEVASVSDPESGKVLMEQEPCPGER